MWSQIEVDIGILAASLPCLSPLLKLVWSGFSTIRAGTPSQVPTIPGYRGSWEEKDYSKNSVSDVEKSPRLGATGYYDDAWDMQEQIGAARTANARIAVKTEVSGICYTKI